MTRSRHYLPLETASEDPILDSAPRHEESLGEFLAARARRASEGRLAGHAITAVVAAIAISAWRGPAWEIRLALAVIFVSYGIWGIADRDMAQREELPRRVRVPLQVARVVAAACGFGAAAFLLMALLGRALGRIIS